MAIRLEGPPVKEPMMLKDSQGNFYNNPIWTRWHQLHHTKTGGSEAALPVSLGGSGATSVVGALAVQTASSSSSGGGSSSSSVVTKRQTFSLNSPEIVEDGQTADTEVLWDTPFADANYTVTADYSNSSRGQISITNITAAGFRITLTQVGSRPTFGSADCIGVHA